MQLPRYADVLASTDLESAADAVASGGYATDPDYARKLKSLQPKTQEQHLFLRQRRSELQRSGAPLLLAELGARVSALETGWGKSAPGSNYYGIKAGGSKPLQVAQAGRADVSPGLLSQAQPITPQEAPMYEDEMQPTGMAALMQDPMFVMGASLLSGAGGQAGPLGQGLMRGIAGYQAQQSNNSLQDIRREQIMAARARQQEAERQRAMQQRFIELVASGMGPEAALQNVSGDLGALGVMGALMGIEGAGKLVDYSNARLPYGQMTQAQQAETQDREMRRAMELQRMQYEGQIPGAAGTPAAAVSPKQQQEIAAEGQKAEAKKRAEARVDLPKAEATAAQTLQTIDDLMSHPGRTWATGSIVGRLPALPGDAYDFKAKLEMAKGQVFLRAYETLKGGGQITQIEGEKAERAMATLDRAQSEEAFLKGLKDLRDAVEAGQRKLRESAGVQGSMEGPAPAGKVDWRWQNGRMVPAR